MTNKQEDGFMPKVALIRFGLAACLLYLKGLNLNYSRFSTPRDVDRIATADFKGP